MKIRSLYLLMLFAIIGGATPATLAACSVIPGASSAEELVVANPLAEMKDAADLLLRFFTDPAAKSICSAHTRSAVVVKFNAHQNTIEYFFRNAEGDHHYRTAPLPLPAHQCRAFFEARTAECDPVSSEALCWGLWNDAETSMPMRTNKDSDERAICHTDAMLMFMCKSIEKDILGLVEQTKAKALKDWSDLEMFFFFSIVKSIKIAAWALRTPPSPYPSPSQLSQYFTERSW
jgi:hypothetical protein